MFQFYVPKTTLIICFIVIVTVIATWLLGAA